MDRKELIKKSSQELAKLLFELQQELFVLKFQASIGKLESSAKFKNIKKEIARIHTIQIEQSRNLKRIPKSSKTLDKIRQRELNKKNEIKETPQETPPVKKKLKIFSKNEKTNSNNNLQEKNKNR